jgi:prophage maintenance system killer protein
VGLIVFEQPFNNANKATSTSLMFYFLRSNGYRLDLESENVEDKLLEILNNVVYLFEGESQKGVSMVDEFLRKHVRKL